MVKLFSNLPSKKNYINAYQHIFGYFSKFASKEEKVFILQLMEKYRDGKIDKSAIASILKGYCECFRTLPGSHELLTLATDS